MKTMRCFVPLIVCLAAVGGVSADGLQDNSPQTVRRVPRLGLEISAETRNALADKLAQLGSAIEDLRERDDATIHDLLPDVMIYHRAVDQALNFQEFFKEREIAGSDSLLDEGLQRASGLARGAPNRSS